MKHKSLTDAAIDSKPHKGPSHHKESAVQHNTAQRIQTFVAMNVPDNAGTEIGQQLDSINFQTKGREQTTVVSTTTGVYELITCTCREKAQCKHKQSCLRLLNLGARDPLWTLRNNNSNRPVSIENGYHTHQYQPACVFGVMKIADVTPSENETNSAQRKNGEPKSQAQDSNEISFRSRFYTVTCHNVPRKSKTVVSVVHNDVHSDGYGSGSGSGHAAKNLELMDTKILQIVPASQGRYLLLGTKIVTIQVRPDTNDYTALPGYSISLLQSSAAPNLPLVVSGRLEYETLVVSCPYAVRSRDHHVRIPLPHCLR
ncbi:unnamed protein product [Kluyveromyces dobzhanskii CBS 2104]|uniref:WGS project CCBQ000000000 data, contig 00272 n=1 Tax=Kluyveromyces dobzhanskii CBS 2104 TaxID=1427455 RepID=A0A0A8L8C9_9SACH|nr:unnamed protein product [Kluyveromyces dobzhanskii CBS 2104]